MIAFIYQRTSAERHPEQVLSAWLPANSINSPGSHQKTAQRKYLARRAHRKHPVALLCR